VALPVNGLLTYVPQQFFDDEFRANALTARTIYDLMGRYIPSSDDIGPPGPLGWLRPGDLVSRTAMERIVESARQHRPDLFRLMVETIEASQRAAQTASSSAS
jgi:hypothetical protein